MGIRFYCPQGHKLNVKSFLAGKKGFCPHCNAKVDIPVRSTRPSTKEDKQKLVQSAMVVPVTGPGAASSTATHSAPLARPVSAPTQNAPMALPVGAPGQNAGPARLATVAGAATASAATAPVSGPALTVPVVGPASVAVTSPPASAAPVVAPAAPVSSANTPGAAAPAPQQTAATSTVDPIAESPHAVWYVRPALGGQYGPASGDMLRQWIQQGRVAADSLVWRDGWPNWQPAGVVLPQASGSTPTGGLPDGSQVNLPLLLDSMPTKPMAGRGGLRKHSNMTVTIIVILLAVIALALAGVLISMLSRT